ncbi:MAG TPA: hypothetical protein VLT62_07500 [Candidatus Methylomirabilis sp.]|nr:hypothetical protein [Candidatus Methylomirabilis sp.]
MTIPQWMLSIGLLMMVVGVMIGTIAQGSPVARYVAVSGVVPIAIGGIGVLVQRLRARRKS